MRVLQRRHGKAEDRADPRRALGPVPPLRVLGLRNSFQKRKPEPDLFLHAAAEFDAEPKNCVVVEDSISGVKAGVAAGMRVIGFTGGSHTHQGHADELTDAGAETVVRRLIDIPPIIEVFAEWEGMPA